MEGGRRISASPRPCNGRRVVAKKRPRVGGVDGFVNSVKKLQRREISSKRDRAFTMSDAQERFRNIRLQEEYDTHDPKGHCAMVLPFLRKRSKIIEIVAARDIVFALAQSGVCAAFSRETNQRICFLNVSPDEVIRSLFYNKNNDSLITVSVYASDNFSSLKCRSTRIEYIRRGKPDAGFALFESESLKWPGFVEFDDVNGKVLTYSAQDNIYKVFDLKNYTMLYSISDKHVQEIKISPGIMLLIFTKASSHVPLKILSIEDGTVLKSFNHLLHRNKKVDFIEQFNEKLLVKQENENLQILDVRNFELTEVSRTEFMTPSAFIFLYENQLFLTFRNRTVAVWNFRGELVCVSTGVLLSGQTACPEASVEEPSSTDVIASTSSVASIVRSASSVEASSLAGVLTSSIPYPHTTSTIYGTNTRTDELGSIVTETIILSTTICPITATEGRATPSPSSRNVNLTTTTQTTTGSIKSAATLYSTITLSGEKTTLAAENTTSTVVILQTDTVIPEAYTSQVSVAAYTSSTTSTQEISTAIPIRSSPSVPASADSDGSVPTSSTGANSGETTSISSAACVASGALVSGETACPELPIKAINTSIAISSQTFNTSISAIKAPTVLSMATVTPIQSTPTPVATSVEGVITPQSSTQLQPGTVSPIISTPIYATTSFVTRSTSTPTNSTSFQTTTSSTTSATATNIAIDTATQGHIETFTFAIPSAYSPTGTSDSSAVTGYSYVDSGVSRVRARGSLVIAMGVMALGLVI